MPSCEAPEDLFCRRRAMTYFEHLSITTIFVRRSYLSTASYPRDPQYLPLLPFWHLLRLIESFDLSDQIVP